MNSLNFFRNLIVCSLLGATLLYSFDGYFDKRFPVVGFLPKGESFVLNPLDAVLGEKKLDDGSFRKDNFQEILHLRASFLKDSSRLYSVRQVTDDLFLLTRKEFFYQNRKYSLFVKTAGNRIVYCYPVKDFAVRDCVFSDQKIWFISDDYTEIASPWRPTYTVRISCMDTNFRELWQTASIPNKGYFFYGEGLRIENDQLIAHIVVQRSGGSTMCVDHFSLTLSKAGIATGSLFTGTFACGGRNTEDSFVLADFFRSN